MTDWLREQRWRIAAVASVVAVIVVGKQFYRGASAADLRWILAPTAHLVSWFTGGHFTYDAGAGYADYKIGFIIAPPCAGMNFLLAAFLALVLGALSQITGPRLLAIRLFASAAIAYVAAIIVNTIRIAIAVAMHRGTIGIGTMDRGEAHRLEGIVVYLGGLCLLYAFARRKASFAIPIAAYLVITLGLPLANGASRRGELAHHAMCVLVACAIVFALHAFITHHRKARAT